MYRSRLCFRYFSGLPVYGYVDLVARGILYESDNIFAALGSAGPRSAIALFELSMFRWFAAANRKFIFLLG